MKLPENPFKRALRAGRQQIGLWSSLASHVSVEILAGSGFDWLLLDMEHSPNELPMVHSQLQACAGTPTHPIVRPPWNDMVTIKRLLDSGAQTLLIPYVETEDEARDAVCSRAIRPTACAAMHRRRGLRASDACRIIRSIAPTSYACSYRSRAGLGCRMWSGSRPSKASTACSSGQAICPRRSGMSATSNIPTCSRASTRRSDESSRQASRLAS